MHSLMHFFLWYGIIISVVSIGECFMNVRKILFIVFTVIAICFFAAGVMTIIMSNDKTFKEWFSIIMLVACALFASAAGFVKPNKERE